MKQSHILAGVGVAMLVLFYVTSVQREGFGSCSPGTVKTSTVLNGGDLTTIRAVPSAADCGTKCCENASCEGYTYNTQNNNCHLKSGTVTESAGPAVFSSATVSRTSGASSSSPAAGALSAPAPWSETKMYVTGDTMTLNGKTYVALHNNDHMGPTNTQFTIYWKELVTVSLPSIPTPTPSSSTSTAGRTDLSGYISRIGTAEDLQKSLTDRAKSTYGSFLSVIASGIAKFGIVVIVGASIVVGVLVVWSMWNAFIGRPAAPVVPTVGAPLMR